IRKSVIIDIVHLIPTSRQCNREIIFLRFILREITAIQQIEFFSRRSIVSYFIQYFYETLILLAIHFLQLDRDQRHFSKNPCRKKIAIRIKPAKNISHIGSNNRFQLLYIAYQQ